MDSIKDAEKRKDSVNMRTPVTMALFFVMVFSSAVGCAALPALHGFMEGGYGVKLSDDLTKRDDFNFLEQRLQLKTTRYFEGDAYWGRTNSSLSFKGDFSVDEYGNGRTDFDLREFQFSTSPSRFVDAKIGRQVLTWGTGDYLFVNDLFPKDYVSFFIGREDEYLKRPSDAFKFSFFPPLANVDLVAAKFTPNVTATGDRLSFFDSFRGGIAGIDSDRDLVEPPFQMSNNEYALRMYRNFGSSEAAFYYFNGFNKNPDSYKDEAARQLFYRRLDVYGSSWRGPFLSGIGNMEFGYYNSREDSDGSSRLVENSLWKILTGYSRDFMHDLKVGLQHLYEQRLDYDNYRSHLLAGDVMFDESRHLLTNRITKFFKNQTLAVSLFTFYSPMDKDGYFRPAVSYDITDQWKIAGGGNLPWGEDDETEFGQMKRNKNIYVRLRYSF